MGRGSVTKGLSDAIFDMILPKITFIEVSERGYYYARAPQAGWQEILKGWHTFVIEGLRWPIFADYQPPIADFLYVYGATHALLNKKFEKQLDGFELLEIELLPSLLTKLAMARGANRGEQFERREIDLLVRFSEIAGDLNVRIYTSTYNVRELIAGRGQTPKSS
jgi:hypothetical protein